MNTPTAPDGGERAGSYGDDPAGLPRDGAKTLGDDDRTLTEAMPPPSADDERTLPMGGFANSGAATAPSPVPGPPTLPIGTDDRGRPRDDLDSTAPYTAHPPARHDALHPPSDGRGSWGTMPANGRLEPGKLLFGRYLIQRQIGRGGMGEVWLVRDTVLDADRVLKTISASIASNPEARSRLIREARAGANVEHENAVRVHDIVLVDEFAFIVMEYVRGESLDKRGQPGAPMPMEWVDLVLRQLCDVLDVAHDRGIVHRDLKPSNLMLVEGGKKLKVLDFGIAKILGAGEFEGDAHTMTNAIMGTPPYMSPEQAEGRSPQHADGRADGRGDLYSVGVILYEFLTGRTPFTGSSAKKLANTLFAEPPPFSEANPDATVPAEVERVVMRCLQKDPAKRPQTAHDLYAEFAAALPVETGLRPPPPPLWTRWIGRIAGILSVGVLLGLGLYASFPRPSPTTIDTPDGPEISAPTDGPARLPVALPVGFVARAVEEDSGGVAYEFVPSDERKSVRLLPEWDDPDARDGPPDALNRPGPSGQVEATYRLVPGGTLYFGFLGESPTAATPTVDIRPLYVQTTEVTNGEFLRFLDEVPGARATAGAFLDTYGKLRAMIGETDEADRHPAAGVTHGLAEQFAAWVGGRLPTSAEWESIARSGGKADRPFVWGNGPPPEPDTDDALIDSIGKPGAPTSTVGYYGKDQTEQGIFDLTGNVREWTATREATPSRLGESFYVVRGGSWASNSARFSTIAEDILSASEAPPDVGFRVVYELNPGASTSDDREPVTVAD